MIDEFIDIDEFNFPVPCEVEVLFDDTSIECMALDYEPSSPVKVFIQYPDQDPQDMELPRSQRTPIGVRLAL